MKKKDNIEKLFERLENQWDNQLPPLGHKERFMAKLNKKNKQPKKQFQRIFTIAASLVISIGLYFFFLQNNTTDNTTNKNFWTETSIQTKETHDYFTSVVEAELKKLQEINSPETQPVIDDALNQMKLFEADYQKILLELQKNGDTKQIIHAMILNLQTQINFLEDVINKIEIINQQKYTENEKIS